MATIAMTTDIDVLAKYESLVKDSLGSESVYIRTKETLDDLYATNTISSSDKAKITSDVLSSLNGTLINAAMSTALQWAGAEKDLYLKKEQVQKELDSIQADTDLKTAQRDNVIADTAIKEEQLKVTREQKHLIQAQIITDYGTPTLLNDDVTSLAMDGKGYQEIQNLVKQGLILDAKEEEAYANNHRIIADTYANFGNYTYAVDDTGIPTITRNDTGTDKLSDYQKVIAKEQAKGYAYNAWSNALVSSSSTLGALIGAQIPVDVVGTPANDFLVTVTDLLGTIQLVQPPTV